MSESAVSTFQEFLYDMKPMVVEHYKPGPLFEMLERDMAERKRKDDAWLATLSPHALRVELTRRRIADVERRYRDWWDEHMAWRFAPYAPERYDEDEW